MMVRFHHPRAPTTRRTWTFSAAYKCSTPTSQQGIETANSLELHSVCEAQNFEQYNEQKSTCSRIRKTFQAAACRLKCEHPSI